MRATFVSLSVCALVAALVAGGCGSQTASISVPTPEQAARRLADAPPPLAALHREASRLLDGGRSAFDRRLAGLRGHPVVVNAWASWCGPCTEEFPLFQRAAVRHGARVAFVGVDVDDVEEEARTFLRDHWVAYPSYVDGDKRIARAIGVQTGLPTTVFYDRRGEVAFVHQGPYRDEAQLTADIERYLRSS